MKIKIAQKQLIIANIVLYIASVIFLEYSKMFRMNQELHWIYSLGHKWYLLVALPCCFWGSIILGLYSVWKVKENKTFHFLFSISPLLLFSTLIYITSYICI